MSIFTRTLIVVIGTSSLALGILAILTLNFSHSYIKQTLSYRMDTLIRSQEVKITQALETWSETAALVSSNTPILRNSYQYILKEDQESLPLLKQALNDLLVSSTTIVKVGIRSVDNEPILSSGLLVNIDQTAILRDISKGKVYGFYQISRSRVGKTYIHVSEPLVYKNSLVGDIDIVFDITGFVEDFFNVGGLGETGYAKVITRTMNGDWVNILDLSVKENIDESEVNTVVSNVNFYDGVFSYFDSERPDFISISKHVSGRAVFLEINVNSSEVFNEIDLFYRQFFSAFGLVVLLTGIIGWRFSRRITQPIREISKEVNTIAKGGRALEFTTKSSHPTEIKSLAININTMANALWEMNDNLEKVVDERTAQLKRLAENLEEKVKERTSEFQEANENLLATVHELNETKNDLVKAEKMASLGSLVAGVAHEINTPLGVAVTGISQSEGILIKLEQEKNSGALTASSFDTYLAELLKITELIAGQLAIASKLISSFKEVAVDQNNADIRVISMYEYLSKVADTVMPQYKSKGINIFIECDDEVEFSTRAGPFSQVISNLLLNAINHAFDNKSSGVVNISVIEYEDNIEVKIEDNGDGIPAANLDKIFDPFYTTKRGQGGSGLGLSIVFNIVSEALHGTIEVNSTEGAGTTFTLQLPNLT